MGSALHDLRELSLTGFEIADRRAWKLTTTLRAAFWLQFKLLFSANKGSATFWEIWVRSLGPDGT
jgi:hypothetical protein